MQATQRTALLGAAALAIGAVLAVALGDKGATSTESAKPRLGPAARQQKLAAMTKASEVPEEKKVAENFAEDRWGHMGETPELLAHVGGAGETVIQPTRVWVGLNGKGEKVYMRAIARLHSQRYERLDKTKKPKVGPVIRISDYKPGPVFQKLKGIKHIDDPADMPEGMEHHHPLYEEPAPETSDQGSGGAAPAESAGAGS